MRSARITIEKWGGKDEKDITSIVKSISDIRQKVEEEGEIYLESIELVATKRIPEGYDYCNIYFRETTHRIYWGRICYPPREKPREKLYIYKIVDPLELLKNHACWGKECKKEWKPYNWITIQAWQLRDGWHKFYLEAKRNEVGEWCGAIAQLDGGAIQRANYPFPRKIYGNSPEEWIEIVLINAPAGEWTFYFGKEGPSLFVEKKRYNIPGLIGDLTKPAYYRAPNIELPKISVYGLEKPSRFLKDFEILWNERINPAVGNLYLLGYTDYPSFSGIIALAWKGAKKQKEVIEDHSRIAGCRFAQDNNEGALYILLLWKTHPGGVGVYFSFLSYAHHRKYAFASPDILQHFDLPSDCDPSSFTNNFFSPPTGIEDDPIRYLRPSWVREVNPDRVYRFKGDSILSWDPFEITRGIGGRDLYGNEYRGEFKEDTGNIWTGLPTRQSFITFQMGLDRQFRKYGPPMHILWRLRIKKTTPALEEEVILDMEQKMVEFFYNEETKKVSCEIVCKINPFPYHAVEWAVKGKRLFLRDYGFWLDFYGFLEKLYIYRDGELEKIVDAPCLDDPAGCRLLPGSKHFTLLPVGLAFRSDRQGKRTIRFISEDGEFIRDDIPILSYFPVQLVPPDYSLFNLATDIFNDVTVFQLGKDEHQNWGLWVLRNWAKNFLHLVPLYKYAENNLELLKLLKFYCGGTFLYTDIQKKYLVFTLKRKVKNKYPKAIPLDKDYSIDVESPKYTGIRGKLNEYIYSRGSVYKPYDVEFPFEGEHFVPRLQELVNNLSERPFLRQRRYIEDVRFNYGDILGVQVYDEIEIDGIWWVVEEISLDVDKEEISLKLYEKV